MLGALKSLEFSILGSISLFVLSYQRPIFAYNTIKMKKALIWISIFTVLLAIPYLVLETEWHELDDSVRKNVKGNFIKLKDGYVHYELLGPDSGRTIVLIHGISTPYIIWDHTIKALADEGYRVLRYDLYGRGYSDRPNVIYNEELYDNQLSDLLDSLKITEKVNLVGLSMGGVIAINFTDCHPDRVADLALIDPAGFVDKPNEYIKMLNTPVVGTYFSGVFGNIMVAEMMKKFFHDSCCVDSVKPTFDEQLKYKGYKKAIINTLCNFNMSNKKEEVERLGKTNRRFMLIWGKEDKVIPFSKSEYFRKLIPDLEFYPIEDAGHAPQYEKPDDINLLLIKFFLKRKVNTKFNIGSLEAPHIKEEKQFL